MGKYITELLGKTHRPQICSVPAGVDSPIQTFQNQSGCSAGGKPFSAVGRQRLNFNFDALPVHRVGRSSRHRKPILQDDHAKPSLRVVVIAFELGYPVPAPILLTALLEKLLIYKLSGISLRELLGEFLQLFLVKYRVLSESITGNLFAVGIAGFDFPFP